MQDFLLLDLPDPVLHIRVLDRYLGVGHPLCPGQSGGGQAAGSCLRYSHSIQGVMVLSGPPLAGLVVDMVGLSYNSVWGGHDDDGGQCVLCALCDGEQEVEGGGENYQAL